MTSGAIRALWEASVLGALSDVADVTRKPVDRPAAEVSTIIDRVLEIEDRKNRALDLPVPKVRKRGQRA